MQKDQGILVEFDFQSSIKSLYIEVGKAIKECIICALKNNVEKCSLVQVVYFLYIKVERAILIELDGITSNPAFKELDPKDVCKVLLIRSVILYRLGDINNAILGLRRAYRVKNSESFDPFYGKSTIEKGELYERKVGNILPFEISETVLSKSYWKKVLNKEKNNLLSIEHLKLKANKHKRDIEKLSIKRKLINSSLSEYLSVLREIMKRERKRLDGLGYGNKYNNYGFVLKHADWLITHKDFHVPELFFIKGDCLARTARLDGLKNIQDVFEVYRKGLNLTEQKRREGRKKEYIFCESIIDLHSMIDPEKSEEKKILLLSAQNSIRDRKLVGKDCSSEKETEFFCIGDLYLAMQKYYNATDSYITALKFLNEARRSSAHYFSLKYSNRLTIITKKIGISQMTSTTREVLEVEREVNDFEAHSKPSKNLLYSRIWLEIGKDFFFTEERKNKNIPRSQRQIPGEYKKAVEAFSEALYTAPSREKARILVERGRAYVRCQKFEDGKKDFETALKMDGEVAKELPFSTTSFSTIEENYDPHFLTPYNFRVSIRELIDIECGRYRKKRLNASVLLDNVRENYISSVQHIQSAPDSRKTGQGRVYQKKAVPIDQYSRRKLSESFYVEGSRDLQRFKFEEDKSFSLKQHKPFRNSKVLKAAYESLTKAIELMVHGSVSKQSISQIDFPLSTKYYLLEIITELIEVSFLSNEYTMIRLYIKEGSALLKQMLAYQNGKQKTREKGLRFIERINLKEKFDIIEAYKISLFEDEKEAIEQAEIRKNTFLSRLISMSKKKRKKIEGREVSYSDIRSFIEKNTAVVYWYVGLSDISTFLLVDNQYEPINVSKGKFDQRRYFDLEKDNRYRRYIELTNKWNFCLKEIKEGSGARFFDEMSDCLQSLWEILNIAKIVKELQKNEIKNLVIVPHRDLHKFPIHVFFTDFFVDYAVTQYNISYLPSLEIGNNLDNRPVPTSGLLAIHPNNPSSNDLLSAYAEAAGVRLRFSDHYSSLLEGSGTDLASYSKVSHYLKRDISYNLLHFLGHANHSFDKPASSALILSEKRKLTLKEILDDLDLSHYHLVCLSACETGITSTENLTDEYVGLVSGFLTKGVNYVVSSLWRIEDISSTLIMLEFYKLITTTINSTSIEDISHPVVALSRAQNWLRTSNKHELSKWCKRQFKELSGLIEGSETKEKEKLKFQLSLDLIEDYAYFFENHSEFIPFQHPYYWAGYTITGLSPSALSF